MRRLSGGILRWTASLLLLAVLSACRSLPELPTIEWPFTPATPTPAPQPIRVLGWSGTAAENRVLQEAILAFEATHPDIPVTGLLAPDYPAALEEAWLDNEPPDLFLAGSHQLADLVAAGRIQPIPAALLPTLNVPPNLASGLDVDGKRVCWPRDVSTLAVYVNPRLFTRSETPLPAPGWTWDDLRAAAEATTDSAFGLYGLVMARDLSRLHTFLLQASTDGDVWRGDDVLPALEFFTGLYTAGIAVEPGRVDAIWNGDAFGRGKAAMTLEGPWLRPFLAREFPLLDYTLVELPTGPARRGSSAYLTCWVVSATSSQPAAAHALAAHLTRAETTLAWANAAATLPPDLGLATRWLATSPDGQPFVNALAYASPWTGGVEFSERVARLNRQLVDAADDLEGFAALLAQLSED